MKIAETEEWRYGIAKHVGQLSSDDTDWIWRQENSLLDDWWTPPNKANVSAQSWKVFEHWIFGATDSSTGRSLWSALAREILSFAASFTGEIWELVTSSQWLLQQIEGTHLNAHGERRRWRGMSGCEWGGERRRWVEPALPWFGKHTNTVSSANEQMSAMAKQLEMPYGVRVIRRVKGFLLHLLLEHIFADFSNILRSIFSSWFSKIYLSFLKKVADCLSSSLCELRCAQAVISFPWYNRFCEFYKYTQNMVWMPNMCTMQVDTSKWKTWKNLSTQCETVQVLTGPVKVGGILCRYITPSANGP
jgi:hypothetical protein